jgi:hypothetical protein
MATFLILFMGVIQESPLRKRQKGAREPISASGTFLSYHSVRGFG